jgi:hypothetical protein
MRRRDVIALIGGAAAWPFSARAQQPDRVRRVGMLIGYAENDQETQARLAAFRQSLERLGWTEDGNVRIDHRFAPAGPDQGQLYAKGWSPCDPTCWSAIQRQPVPRSCGRQAQSRSYLWVYPIL